MQSLAKRAEGTSTTNNKRAPGNRGQYKGLNEEIGCQHGPLLAILAEMILIQGDGNAN